MQQVYFEVSGNPIPKARARTVRKGGRTWSFTPKKVADWEKTVKQEAVKYFKQPFKGPVMVSIIFYLERPESRRKDVWVSTMPDLDNLEKAVLDALNNVAYEDDRFVVAKNAQKKYIKRDEPHVTVRVTCLSKQVAITSFAEKE